MQKIVIALVAFIAFSAKAQIRYATYGKEKHGKYSYIKVQGDPTNSRWYVLENGLTVILAVNKDQPRVQTLIATKAGSKNDPADNTGLAHYLEHLLFKGTDQYGTQDYVKEKFYLDQIDNLYEQYNKTRDTTMRKRIYRQIDSVSGLAAKYSIANEFDKICQSIGAQNTNAFTSVEQTVYVNDIPSNMIHQWIELESERYRNPVFRLFHTELEAVYEEKNISLDNDAEEAYEKLNASLFRQHPYGTQTTIGTVEHLKNPSLIKIREYFNTYYVPNNMAVIMAGDFDPEIVIEMIDHHFGSMKSKPVPAFTFKPEYPRGRPDSISVTGPDAANLMMAWRFDGVASKEAMMVRIIDLILSNNKAGLIDLNLVKEQKVLSASSSPDFMKDYTVHMMFGKPKAGQSLEEVRDLLLEQLNNIKKGNFDEKLLKGIIANNTVDNIRQLEDNSGIAYSMLDAFITGRKWMDVLNINYEMSKITKADIVEFANEYYTDGYSIVYKRTGEDTKQAKIDKPNITEVDLNRDKTSKFVTELLEEESDTIYPKFIDYNKDIHFSKIGNSEVLYKKNDKNQLFTLYYVVEMGKLNDKKLPFALDYLQYVGTDKLSASELSMKFYQLACNFGISAGEKRSYVYLNGPQENFKEALQLFEDLLANAKPDQKALEDYIGRQLKGRADAKLNKRAISSALSSYALYGKVNPRTYTLTNAELQQLKADELITIIKNLTKYYHQVMYYGPQDNAGFTADILALHKFPATVLPTPAAYVFKPQTVASTQVYFAHYEMVQAEINWRHTADIFDINKAPVIRAYNEYFGGGMSSVVFQEIRESRALAYSTYSYYSQATEKGKNDILLAYVGTQADKMNDAITAMNELLNNMPDNEESFNQAKQAIISSIEAERINQTDVFFSYLSAVDMGISFDNRKAIYEAIKSMQYKDIKAFQEQHVKGQKWIISILGSKEKIKTTDLSKYGEVHIVTLEEIFGY
ncbi:MAG: insulinase family protein [Bacteroidota bacterium]